MMDTDSAILLATATRRCLDTFDVLASSLQGSSSGYSKKMSPEALLSQNNRLKIWADNLGVFQHGSASLDFRLQGLSSMKTAINRYFEQLNQILTSSIEIVQDKRPPLEAFLESEEEMWESSSDSSLGLEEKSFSKTELGQNLKEIGSILSDLFKISFKIRDPATRSTAQSVLRALPYEEIARVDATTEADHSSFSTQFDRALVQKIFGDWRKSPPGGLSGQAGAKDGQDYSHDAGGDSNEPGKYLIERWCRSITNRRRFFAYWRKLAENSAKEEMQPNFISDLATSTQYGYEKDAPSTTQTPTSFFSSKPTEDTRFAQNLDAEIDAQSIVSTASSAYHVDDSASELPPAPQVPDGKHEFQCPYCWIVCPSCHFTEMKRWKNHILRDIQPYMCTYPDCSDPDVLYSTRTAWLDHEAQVHRQVFRCFEHPEIFISKEYLKSHLESSHLDLKEHQIQLMADIGHASGPDNRDTCPFCFSKGPFRNSFVNHLAYHQERLASFAAKDLQPDEVKIEEFPRDQIEDPVPKPLAPSIFRSFSSELSGLSDVIAAAQTVIDTCKAIDVSMTAIKGTPEILQRWTITGQTFRTTFEQFEDVLEEMKITHLPGATSTYYRDITAQLNVFSQELKKLEDDIASTNLAALASNTTSSFKDPERLAFRIRRAEDDQLFESIDRHIRILSINVDLMKALNNGSMNSVQRALRVLAESDQEFIYGGEQPDWQSSAAKVAEQPALQSLSHSEVEAPAITSTGWDVKNMLSILEKRNIQKRSIHSEKEDRLTACIQRVDRMEAANIPMLASKAQLEVIRLWDELNQARDYTPSFKERFPLQERYVKLLMSAGMNSVFGERARRYLEDEIIRNLDRRDPDLRDIWLSVGQMYHAMNATGPAEEFLRLALFEGYTRYRRNTSRSEIGEISKFLCQIYEETGRPENAVALRHEVKLRIGYDSIIVSGLLDKARKWCHEKGFHVEILEDHLIIRNGRNRKDNTALHEAALDTEIDATIVPKLVENGMLAIENADGDTALLLAIDKSNEAVVKSLLQTPSLVQVRDREHRTPLHRCRNHKILRLALYAIEQTTIHAIFESPSSVDVSLLVNIDSTDACGRSALLIMCEQGRSKMMRQLLEAGADVKKSDRLGMSPILACSASNIGRARKEKMILRLLEKHADPDQQDTYGNTARSELRQAFSSKAKVEQLLDQNPTTALLAIEGSSAPERGEIDSTASTIRKGLSFSGLFNRGVRGSSSTD